MTRAREPSARLSRERIVEVALAMAEREGVEALSMRRIAAELGTGAMSLYNHVPDKAALLRAVAERVVAEVELPAQADWTELCRTWATSLRGTLLAHRAVVPIVVRTDQAGSLQRVSLELYEALVASLLRPADARRVVSAVGRYVAGSILLEVGGAAGQVDRARADSSFSFGLEALLVGLRASIRPADPAPADARPEPAQGEADAGAGPGEHGHDGDPGGSPVADPPPAGTATT